MIHEFKDLPYDYDALEPIMDKETMMIHHDRHHKAYFDKFITAITGTSLEEKPIVEILSNTENIPDKIKTAVVNNGGGFYNHELFWNIMKKEPTKPSDELVEAISNKFASVENFKEEFGNAAKTHFGSGWAWLVVNKNKELEIVTTKNQDSPLSNGQTPILGIDVWEHAYYLKYQNKRPDFVDGFLKVINWEKVSEYYKDATQ